MSITLNEVKIRNLDCDELGNLIGITIPREFWITENDSSTQIEKKTNKQLELAASKR